MGLPEWERRVARGDGSYRRFQAHNDGYATLGILVPLSDLVDAADLVEAL